MSKLVSETYFTKLKQKKTSDVCLQACCKYDFTENCYIVRIWDDNYAVFPDKKKIKRVTNNLPEPHPFLYIFIMYYITTKSSNKLTNEWISEKDILGGCTFFRGPHEIPTKLVSETFLNDIKSFENKCEKFGGIPISMGDSAYLFKITHNVVVALLYWLGDDNLSPAVKLLFDKSMGEYFPLDIIFSLASDICNRFVS